MKSQNVFIVHPKTTEEVSALAAFMKALKIKFEISKGENYDPEFVSKIEKSRAQVKKGQVTRIAKDNLSQLLEL